MRELGAVIPARPAVLRVRLGVGTAATARIGRGRSAGASFPAEARLACGARNAGDATSPARGGRLESDTPHRIATPVRARACVAGDAGPVRAHLPRSARLAIRLGIGDMLVLAKGTAAGATCDPLVADVGGRKAGDTRRACSAAAVCAEHPGTARGAVVCVTGWPADGDSRAAIDRFRDTAQSGIGTVGAGVAGTGVLPRDRHVRGPRIRVGDVVRGGVLLDDDND